MTQLVNPSEIESIVGAHRQVVAHVGRWITDIDTVFIMHSHHCLDRKIDLRECEYSTALDRGLDPDKWLGKMDVAVFLDVRDEELIPLGKVNEQ